LIQAKLEFTLLAVVVFFVPIDFDFGFAVRAVDKNKIRHCRSFSPAQSPPPLAGGAQQSGVFVKNDA
jgi:hypothetical protein